MKRFLISVSAVVFLSVTAAFVTFLVAGPPERVATCDPRDLPEHHVCLATVREWPEDQVLWVDARPRVNWNDDGVEGSILINDQEDWQELEPEFMFQMSNDERKSKVVVYCNQSGCGSSKYVADQLRERHAETFGCEVYVLEGGIKALRAEEEG